MTDPSLAETKRLIGNALLVGIALGFGMKIVFDLPSFLFGVFVGLLVMLAVFTILPDFGAA